MELETYADAVAENYQRLADILQSSAPDSSKVERLLSIDLLPVITMKRGYAVWSEGIVAEALACFPTQAFPRLLEALRTAPDHTDVSRIYKALTMWGDDFASALSNWLDAADARVRGRAVYGLTLYAKLLNTLYDSEAPSIEKRLHRENYPELVRLMREWEMGVAPTVTLSDPPRARLSQRLSHLLTDTSDDTQQIAILRCLGRLGSPTLPLSESIDTIVAIATEATSRSLEREAVIALCHLDRAQASEYIQHYWLQDPQRRNMAAEILGLVRSETAFAMLQDLLTDPNAETRRKAISSIESFESVDALDVLNALQERDQKALRQLLRSRNQLKRRLQRNSLAARKKQNPIYSISPLILLSQVPAKPVFSERMLTASIDPELIADISSSRRYAVELGLLERRADVYRLSGMGATIHWVEAYLQDGLKRLASATFTHTNRSIYRAL
ncbi:MAG: HEAT repeat domain-containing protein [Candidatus Tectomicrobia bacterium]|nr:HEAT repeat domain-containing protein [Candidatus Tectomicrobia bacterium]